MRSGERRDKGPTRNPVMDGTTIQTLQKVDDGLRRKGFRGHVYFLREGSVLIFTTTSAAVHGGMHNIGPRPVIDAVHAVQGKTDVEAWFNSLRQAGPEDLPAPRTVWNTRHLLITGVTARHGLAWVAEHPHFYRKGLLNELVAATGISSVDEVASLFRRTTGRELPERSRKYFNEMQREAPGVLSHRP